MEFQAAMKILRRMCTTLECDECPFHDLGVHTCRENLYTYPQEAETILAEWAAENPERTLMDDFFEKHPKAKNARTGLPRFAQQILDMLMIHNAVVLHVPNVGIDRWRRRDTMTERERLIKLLDERIAIQECSFSPDKPLTTDSLADYLLEHGVIVPPCKVGDTVYVLDVYPDNCKCADCDNYYPGGYGDNPECEASKDGYRRHECIEIREEKALRQSVLTWLMLNDFGKHVFLTREEAEAALADRRIND